MIPLAGITFLSEIWQDINPSFWDTAFQDWASAGAGADWKPNKKILWIWDQAPSEIEYWQWHPCPDGLTNHHHHRSPRASLEQSYDAETWRAKSKEHDPWSLDLFRL